MTNKPHAIKTSVVRSGWAQYEPDEWTASVVVDGVNRDHRGRTRAEAIGKAVLAHGNQLGIAIEGEE